MFVNVTECHDVRCQTTTQSDDQTAGQLTYARFAHAPQKHNFKKHIRQIALNFALSYVSNKGAL